jgi:cell division protein FtsB
MSKVRGHENSRYSHLKWIIPILAALAVVSGIGFTRETLRSRQIDAEIAALKREAEDLQAKNFEILSLRSSLESGEFLEKEARTKLGLQREGEKVVVIDRAVASAPDAVSALAAAVPVWSNPKKWLMYFSDRAAFDSYARLARCPGAAGGDGESDAIKD